MLVSNRLHTTDVCSKGSYLKYVESEQNAHLIPMAYKLSKNALMNEFTKFILY